MVQDSLIIFLLLGMAGDLQWCERCKLMRASWHFEPEENWCVACRAHWVNEWIVDITANEEKRTVCKCSWEEYYACLHQWRIMANMVDAMQDTIKQLQAQNKRQNEQLQQQEVMIEQHAQLLERHNLVRACLFGTMDLTSAASADAVRLPPTKRPRVDSSYSAAVAEWDAEQAA